VPLKPIFDKAPLTAMTCQPLSAGMVRTDAEHLKQLYALVRENKSASSLEGAFRLAALLTARPDEEPAAAAIRAALAAQKEDGSYALPLTEAIAVLRAGWALYEYEARKPLLEYAARWCAWASKNWDVLAEDDELWANPADLLELLENLYRVTGKSALLTLCERVSAQTMAWSTVLNTVSAQRPTNKSVTVEELNNGLYGVADRDSYYQRFYLTNHAESLADGARASMARGWFSGSATEMNAARTGWERLQRHHGAICGGLTSDEMLEGTSPAAPVSTAAIGAWAEALCAAALGTNTEWAWAAAERLALNAMPACIDGNKLLPFQRVNTLSGTVADTDCFFVNDDHASRAADRIARGWAAIASSAVTACTDGLAVNLFLPGRYAVPVGEGLIVISMQTDNGHCSISVHTKQEQKATIRLRLPEWSRNIEIAVNGAVGDAGRECRAGFMSIERTWHDGDVVTVTLEETLHVVSAHHQGKYVMHGAILMVMPAADGCWAKSFIDAECEDSQVTARLDSVREWKLTGGEPADVPVLPAASGMDAENVALVPYASVRSRIALFPGRKMA